MSRKIMLEETNLRRHFLEQKMEIVIGPTYYEIISVIPQKRGAKRGCREFLCLRSVLATKERIKVCVYTANKRAQGIS